MNNSYHHIPVLLTPSVDALIGNPSGVYIDATLGGAGHSRAILNRLDKNATLFGFDQDDAVGLNLPQDDRFVWIKSNFKYLKKYMEYYKIEMLDGVLADLGVSSFHFDEDQRGFSFQSQYPLDMRMNSSQPLRAIDILQQYSEVQLTTIFFEYGELTNAKKIAQAIIQDRKNRRWDSCIAFANWADAFVYGKRNKWMAQLFQALRIEVNQELSSLEMLLQEATDLLKKDGKLVVISYHSLEDRMVKNWMKQEKNVDLIYGKKDFLFSSWSKHAIVPDEKELEENSRSRSAKMRVGIKA
ncbi:MAG: 16S rRNA (cytosine(1402)-N(4))-methyltransferase RsmH [Saprospiraceae bacterium]|mgnify:CR=1 FL=1|nr:16S rRNA (cytosine(1402)-N(4))-methyltransferase RsmH [Saprospiraceae bacterium]